MLESIQHLKVNPHKLSWNFVGHKINNTSCHGHNDFFYKWLSIFEFAFLKLLPKLKPWIVILILSSFSTSLFKKFIKQDNQVHSCYPVGLNRLLLSAGSQVTHVEITITGTPNSVNYFVTIIVIIHHLPQWIRSFELFQHRRIAIVSWGVLGLFFLEVCSWGHVSGVWCCPFSI